MTKILVNCLSAKSGGGLAYLRNLLPRLLKLAGESQDVSFKLLCDTNQAKLIDSPGGEILIDAPTASFSALKRAWWERRHLPKIVEEHDIDVVFTVYQIVNAKTRARDVIMVHNMEPFGFERYHYGWKGKVRNKLLRRATMRAVAKADKVIAVSNFVKDQLEETCRAGTNRISRVCHGRDPFFGPHPNRGSDSPFLLTCGSLLPYRRCEDVIEAFARLRDDAGDERHRLLIAGEGTEPAYQAKLLGLVERHQLGDRIEFLGHVPKATMKRLFQECTACILATEIEACPIIAIEAMACGCPIVVAENRPMPEMIGDAAVFYPPRDVDRLAETLALVLSDAALRKELADKALRRSESYNWDLCARETFRILTDWS